KRYKCGHGDTRCGEQSHHDPDHALDGTPSRVNRCWTVNDIWARLNHEVTLAGFWLRICAQQRQTTSTIERHPCWSRLYRQVGEESVDFYGSEGRMRFESDAQCSGPAGAGVENGMAGAKTAVT